MPTETTIILLPNGRKRSLRRLAHESRDEYSGRKLCQVEEWINDGKRGPAPKGTRWAEWDNHVSGLGVVYESTGNPYQDRKVRVPGLYSEAEARAIVAPRFYLTRVRLNQGGYDRRGQYWGVGQPLYRYTTDDMDDWRYIRVDDRADAKDAIEGLYPGATFYR
jgi:hypothetical protein